MLWKELLVSKYLCLMKYCSQIWWINLRQTYSDDYFHFKPHFIHHVRIFLIWEGFVPLLEADLSRRRGWDLSVSSSQWAARGKSPRLALGWVLGTGRWAGAHQIPEEEWRLRLRFLISKCNSKEIVEGILWDLHQEMSEQKPCKLMVHLCTWCSPCSGPKKPGFGGGFEEKFI